MSRTEAEIATSCMRSVQRDINKHLDRIKELNEEGKFFMAWLRDTKPTEEEFLAMMEARIWWEEHE